MPVHTWKSGLQEVASGVYAYIQSRAGWDVCNTGFVVGDDGVMVVDAMMVASMVRPYLEQLRKITNKPIRYVVNTHHHLDHCFGNQFYLPAEILSHYGCREALVARGVNVEMLQRQWPQYREDWPQVRLTPASLTYSQKMTVRLGDRAIELLHPGTAHTYGDTLVYLPEEKVLYTGDVAFHYLTPLAADGHVTRWIRALDGIIKHMEVAALVPGHGPVGGKEACRLTQRYLRLLRRTSRAQFQRGATEEETARAISLGQYSDWSEPERVLRNVRRVYQELRDELPKPTPKVVW